MISMEDLKENVDGFHDIEDDEEDIAVEMDELYNQLYALSEEERRFLKQFQELPRDIQDLMRIFILGDPEQSEEAEKTMYDILESQGHDVTELRANMVVRREREAKEREHHKLNKEKKREDSLRP